MLQNLNKIFLAQFILLSSALLYCVNTKAQKQQKVLFVIADGIPEDLIRAIPMPNLQAMCKTGGITTAYVGGEKNGYSETPTISSNGYNSLLTGTWVNKHNVWGNEIADPNYNYWNIFRLFKEAYPTKKTGIFSTWIDNRTKLIGSDAAAAGNLQTDYVFDGMELDTMKYPHDTAGYFYNVIDDAVVDTAAAVIKRSAPDLSWVYLEYTDEMGHRHGNGEIFNESIKLLDEKIKRLWDAVQQRQKFYNEEWHVIITTDHGREANGYHHGGQSERERTTWIATNSKKLNKYFFNQQPAIVDIFPTIASILKIQISKEKLMEVDGVSFVGKISASNLTATFSDGRIKINWLVHNTKGVAKVWLATTNNFKAGGEDEYKLMSEVPVRNGSAILDVTIMPSKFYKLVVEMRYNILNRWIMVQ